MNTIEEIREAVPERYLLERDGDIAAAIRALNHKNATLQEEVNRLRRTIREISILTEKSDLVIDSRTAIDRIKDSVKVLT